jgi:hypothetical protein
MIASATKIACALALAFPDGAEIPGLPAASYDIDARLTVG